MDDNTLPFPFEIRTLIYQFYYADYEIEAVIIPRTREPDRETVVCALENPSTRDLHLVTKQVRREALPIFYQTCPMNVVHLHVIHCGDSNARDMYTLDECLIAAIQRVSISIPYVDSLRYLLGRLKDVKHIIVRFREDAAYLMRIAELNSQLDEQQIMDGLQNAADEAKFLHLLAWETQLATQVWIYATRYNSADNRILKLDHETRLFSVWDKALPQALSWMMVTYGVPNDEFD